MAEDREMGKNLDSRTRNVVRYYLPENDMLEQLTGLFSAFSDETRVRMVSALSITEMCVTDLAEVLNVNQTTVSHQLKLLRNSGVVQGIREGKTVYYSLKSPVICDLMLMGVKKIEEM